MSTILGATGNEVVQIGGVAGIVGLIGLVARLFFQATRDARTNTADQMLHWKDIADNLGRQVDDCEKRATAAKDGERLERTARLAAEDNAAIERLAAIEAQRLLAVAHRELDACRAAAVVGRDGSPGPAGQDGAAGQSGAAGITGRDGRDGRDQPGGVT